MTRASPAYWSSASAPQRSAHRQDAVVLFWMLLRQLHDRQRPHRVAHQEGTARPTGLSSNNRVELVGSPHGIGKRPSVARVARCRHGVADGQEVAPENVVAILRRREPEGQSCFDDSMGVEDQVAVPVCGHVDLVQRARAGGTLVVGLR